MATLQEKQSQSLLVGASDARTLDEYRRASANSSRNSLIQSYMTNTYNGEQSKSRSTTSLYKQGENNSQLSMNSNKNKTLPKAPVQTTSTSSNSPASNRGDNQMSTAISYANQSSQDQVLSRASQATHTLQKSPTVKKWHVRDQERDLMATLACGASA